MFLSSSWCLKKWEQTENDKTQSTGKKKIMLLKPKRKLVPVSFYNLKEKDII